MNTPLAMYDTNPRSFRGFVDARASLRNHMWVFVSRPVGGREKVRDSLHVMQDSKEGKEQNLNDAAMLSERRRDKKAGRDKAPDRMSSSFDEMVGQTMDSIATFDLKANVNTLMFLNGAVLVEKGMAELWDIAYGDGFESNVASIFLGLTIIAITRIFNLPLAEWKKRDQIVTVQNDVREGMRRF